MYRQFLIATGGSAPIIRSRAIPPELPAAKDNTRTPKRSSLCLTPAVAPLSAKTKVPPRSKAISSVFTGACSLSDKVLLPRWVGAGLGRADPGFSKDSGPHGQMGQAAGAARQPW